MSMYRNLSRKTLSFFRCWIGRVGNACLSLKNDAKNETLFSGEFWDWDDMRVNARAGLSGLFHAVAFFFPPPLSLYSMYPTIIKRLSEWGNEEVKETVVGEKKERHYDVYIWSFLRASHHPQRNKQMTKRGGEHSRKKKVYRGGSTGTGRKLCNAACRMVNILVFYFTTSLALSLYLEGLMTRNKWCLATAFQNAPAVDTLRSVEDFKPSSSLF